MSVDGAAHRSLKHPLAWYFETVYTSKNMYVEHIMFLKIQIVMLEYFHLIVKMIALFCPSWSIGAFHYQIIKSKLVTHSTSIYLLRSYHVFQGLF